MVAFYDSVLYRLCLMIITRTPFRISFFGGGTDYHSWYQEHGGAVISTTINHYCNLICSFRPPFFEGKHRIVWREVEDVNDVKDIKHPAVKAVLEYMEIKRGVEIMYKGDLPARSGLGSSSAFTVGMLNAMYSLRGQLSTKQQLAAEAVHIERDILKENVGVQDQIAAAYGGLNKIIINQEGTFQVEPLPINPLRLKDLKNHLMLFFTGVSRNATDIAKDQVKNIPNRKNELNEMRQMVDISCDILMGNTDIKDFGKLMNESWKLKKSLSKAVSTDFIDDIYNKAMNAGAIGGKVLGAGGGGFILFFVKPEDQPKVLEELCDLLWIPFDFENQGSHIAFYNPSQFTRESLIRRDFAHLKSKNVQSINDFFAEEEGATITRLERMTQLNIVK